MKVRITDPMGRRVWRELIEKANKKSFDILLVRSRDRISRSASEVNKIAKRLKALGIESRSCD